MWLPKMWDERDKNSEWIRRREGKTVRQTGECVLVEEWMTDICNSITFTEGGVSSLVVISFWRIHYFFPSSLHHMKFMFGIWVVCQWKTLMVILRERWMNWKVFKLSIYSWNSFIICIGISQTPIQLACFQESQEIAQLLEEYAQVCKSS